MPRSSSISQLLSSYRFVWIIAISWCIIVLFQGSMWQVQWSPVDDHEIFYFIGGARERLSPMQIPATLIEKTEVGSFGETSRYRPSYYVLRVIESSLWGKSPALWYFARTLFFTFAFVMCWMWVSKFYGYFVGLLFTTTLLRFGFWADIFHRIAPAEIYGLLGIACISLGIHLFRRHNRSGWLTIAIGTLIAIGSKENFIFLAIVPWVVLVKSYIQSKKLSRLGASISLITGTYASLIVISVLSGLQIAKSTTIYGDTVSAVSTKDLFIQGLIGVLKGTPSLYLLVCGMYALFLVILIRRKSVRIRDLIRPLAIGASFYLATAVVIALQYAFYSGNWPGSARYDFPGVLLFDTHLIIIVWTIVSTLPPGKIRVVLYRTVLVFQILLLIPNMASTYSNLLFLNSRTQEVKTTTYEFTKRIQQSTQILREYPQAPLILYSDKSGDFELIVSIQRFLAGSGVKNPIMLRYDAPHTSPDVLVQMLVNLERTGMDTRLGYRYPVFAPLKEVKKDAVCYVWELSPLPSDHAYAHCAKVQ